MPDSAECGVVNVIVEDDELGALDSDFCRRINESDAVHGRCGSLVELAREIFNGNVFLALEVAGVCDAVSYDFPEDAVAALLKELRSEAEEVIDVQQPECCQPELEVLVQFCLEACCLYLKFRMFFYENAVILHICMLCFKFLVSGFWRGLGTWLRAWLLHWSWLGPFCLNADSETRLSH